MPPPEIRVLADRGALARAAAEVFTSAAAAAGERGDFFRVALAGGSTPRDLYRLLADEDEPFRARIPWEAVVVFWGDERHVPPDHPDSNYRMARETLLERAPISADNVHRIHAEEPDAAVAAAQYEATLAAAFRLAPLAPDAAPRFDLILLGLGPEGHTASLFPGSPALHDGGHLVAAPWVEKLAAFRITLTPRALNAAARVLFLVAGEDKAPAVREVLAGGAPPDRYPARVVQPTDGELLWLLDPEAAKLLPPGSPGADPAAR
jgi:6-phosphogluconolactonase